MRSFFYLLIHFAQKFLLWSSYIICSLLIRRSKKVEPNFVVGVDEVASILHQLSIALPESITVNLTRNRLYSHRYSFNLGEYLGAKYFRHIISPILLGYLACRYSKFVYISANGFLNTYHDGRNYEFAFLKKKKAKIICYFTGSDIRSHKLLNAFAEKHKIDVITTYQGMVNKGADSPMRELHRKKLAHAAETYADVIFNPATDQMGYFERETLPFLNFYPDEKIKKNPDKWRNLDRITIVHSPSSPIIKGTPLVRAAIKKLQEEGYQFEYIELLNVKNEVVLKALGRAHIVLSQFYAFVPGIFGIEAMANNSVLVTSADSRFERSLPPDANKAWVVTPYWLIYDNLKKLLDQPEALQQQADCGTDWTLEHCSFTKSSQRLRAAVDD